MSRQLLTPVLGDTPLSTSLFFLVQEDGNGFVLEAAMPAGGFLLLES